MEVVEKKEKLEAFRFHRERRLLVAIIDGPQCQVLDRRIGDSIATGTVFRPNALALLRQGAP